jgi:hypothetical protein
MVQDSAFEERVGEDTDLPADQQAARKIKLGKKQQRKRKRREKVVIEDVLGDFSMQTGSYF